MALIPTLNTRDLDEHIGKLLPSQRAFVFAPETLAVIAGGFASGKTKALSVKGTILSAIIPGNVGMVGRYHASDLEDTTMPVFMETVPPSWIRSYRHHNRGSATVTLRNGSQVLFRHIHDASAKSATKTRRLGANLGWWAIDQMEECEEVHHNAMISRLRLPRAPKKFGFAAINPNGHDWIFRKYFPKYHPFRPGEYYQLIQNNGRLGIAVNSEENRVSNGGFVDDNYFDTMLREYPKEWVDRYIRCSFEDFTGKIYKEYVASIDDVQWASIHNIEPFEIPKHWQFRIGIDVGGDCPWAVIPHFIDDWGNIIVVPGFHENTVVTREVANWIKSNTPWNDNARMLPPVIDPENKVAMLELAQDHDIHCTVAMKAVKAGLLRTASYFHVNPALRLPPWYEETQPAERYAKFVGKGAPRIFVFNTALTWRKEHDTYVWDENKKGEPKKSDTERFDTCDATRYVAMTCPAPSELPIATDKHYAIRQVDPMSAREWDELDRRIADRIERTRGGGAIREANTDEILEYGFQEQDRGNYEWA